MSLTQTKRCPGCKLTKPREAFAVRRASKDGLQIRCRECCSIRARSQSPEDRRRYRENFVAKNGVERLRELRKKSYDRHREERVASVREWESRNYQQALSYRKKARTKRRAKEAAGTLTGAQWMDALECFDWRCAYCLRKLDRPTQEHVIPLCKGGEHSQDNVVPACLRCNTSKGPRPVWYMLDAWRLRRSEDQESVRASSAREDGEGAVSGDTGAEEPALH